MIDPLVVGACGQRRFAIAGAMPEKLITGIQGQRLCIRQGTRVASAYQDDVWLETLCCWAHYLIKHLHHDRIARIPCQQPPVHSVQALQHACDNLQRNEADGETAWQGDRMANPYTMHLRCSLSTILVSDRGLVKCRSVHVHLATKRRSCMSFAEDKSHHRKAFQI